MSYDKKNKTHIVAVNAMVHRGEDGKYLVLKRSENEKAFPGAWCFPGGKVEGNDSVAETLADELFEEAGLKLKSVGLMVRDTAFVRPDDQSVKVFTYLCEVEEGEVKLEAGSFTDCRWVSPVDLSSMEHTNLDLDISAAEELLSRLK